MPAVERINARRRRRLPTSNSSTRGSGISVSTTVQLTHTVRQSVGRRCQHRCESSACQSAFRGECALFNVVALVSLSLLLMLLLLSSSSWSALSSLLQAE